MAGGVCVLPGASDGGGRTECSSAGGSCWSGTGMSAPASGHELPALLRGEATLTRAGLEEGGVWRWVHYTIWIVVGGALFGAAVGCWRAPLQAFYTGVKLPLILLLTTVGNGLLNGMLAPLLGVSLTMRQ